MVKALGALVVSMVLGAFLLAILEPDRSLQGPRPGILLQATSHPDPWLVRQVRSVKVFCESADESGPLSGQAGTGAAAHMIVGPDGRLHPGAAAADSSSQTFLIRVDLPLNAPEVSRRQLEALDALLERVGREFALPLGALHYESHHPRLADLGGHLASLREAFARSR